MTSTESKLHEFTKKIYDSISNSATYQSSVNRAIRFLKSGEPLTEEVINIIVPGMKDVRNALKELNKGAVALYALVTGMKDTSDVKISKTQLEIIKSGELVDQYRTFEDLKSVDNEIKELHRISYLVHCCASDDLYNSIFRPVVDSNEEIEEETQSKKKRKM